MSHLFHTIYTLPISSTVLLLLDLLLLWSLMFSHCRTAGLLIHALCKTVIAALLVLWLTVILYQTIFLRSSGTLIVYRDFFHQLKEYLFHNGDRELLRTLWMNVLLFVPGGLLLEALWPRCFPRWLCAILSAGLLTALSVGIEATQYRYALGCVEADDVLCNGLGGLLGAGMHEAAQRLSDRLALF